MILSVGFLMMLIFIDKLAKLQVVKLVSFIWIMISINISFVLHYLGVDLHDQLFFINLLFFF